LCWTCSRSAKVAGAKNIVGVDINPKKWELAKQFGAIEFINPRDYPNKTIQEFLIEKFDGGMDY
jgi:S-(hydroxymethyl)glutathione dehydrogenase/alcohol dehydrogenase